MDYVRPSSPRFGASHAIVIGGSMSGLLAARILADHFGQVTVVERDQLPDTMAVRKGVPQARHAHGLLVRGLSIINELFPGFTQDIAEHGAVGIDPVGGARWYQHGIWKCRFDSDLLGYCLSRPLLEWRTRTHLLRLPNVRIIPGHDVTCPIFDEQNDRVVGVNLKSLTGEESSKRLHGDLIVDAGGRGSRTPQWLEEAGYHRVAESAIRTDLGYATGTFKRPAKLPDWGYLIQTSAPPTRRSAVILPIEGDRWMVTLYGYFGDHPPTDPDGYLAFARSLPVPDAYDAIRSAELVSPIASYRIPSSLRRHYERMNRFPEGFVVLGDAACSFNPIFGQGMTVAALSAITLHACLSEQQLGNLVGLPVRFHKRLARIINDSWMPAATEDFRYAKTVGPKIPGLKAMQWYTRKLNSMSAHDRNVMYNFVSVVHMMKPASSLFAPKILIRALMT
jgi:2-polyprenyl-6-methoxyphenol hydroxylase-like FAD-dependent oxidoreductase